MRLKQQKHNGSDDLVPRPYVLVASPEGLVWCLIEPKGAVSPGQPRPLGSSAARSPATFCGKANEFPHVAANLRTLCVDNLARFGERRYKAPGSRSEEIYSRVALFPYLARRSPQAAGLFLARALAAAARYSRISSASS